MSTPTAVAEIVTFRLTEGSDPAAFKAAADAMSPLLRATGKALARSLSCDPDGLWTDYILWSDLASAQAAANALMADPVAAPFGEMIDGPSVVMRHADVSLQTTFDAAH